MWLAMIVHRWDSFEGRLGSIPIQVTPPATGSLGFVEVFETREAALAAADGEASLVVEVREVPHG